MIRFKTLSLKNFLSYGAVPTVINLDCGGTTLILGEDLDNTAHGVGANGVGKSVLLNALSFVTYDRPMSDITKDGLVNNVNKKNMLLTLDFEKDEDQYHIERARKMKAGASGNWVKFSKNGKDLTLDAAATNDLIEKVIGMPFELFVRIIAISATHQPYLDLPVRHATQANQTGIIEELFDLKTLSDKATALKVEIKDAEDSLKIHKVRVEGLERERERHEKQIVSAEARVTAWHKTNKSEIATIVGKLKKITGVDIEQQQQMIAGRDIHANGLREQTTEWRDINRAIAALDKENAAQDEKIEHLSNDKCYACHQSIGDAKLQLKECRAIKATNADLRTELQGTATKAHIIREEHQRELVAFESKITVDNIDELIEIKGAVATLESELESKSTATNPFIEPLQELMDIELEDIEMDKINELSTLLEHQKFLLKLLTKKDSFVRKALLTKNIPFLNTRLAVYLLELGLPHTVEFTYEMTANISQFGRPLDFGNLSNGQRARVNLALSFAFRDVLQNIHTRINVCMLDEILDVGLDTVGVTAAAKMLKRKSRDEDLGLFIISHRDEIDSAFDRQMTIQMSKGFSYIKEEQ